MACESVIMYTDGACSGNPGPGGWGAVLHFGDQIKELSGGELQTTNNRMELLAAINGLRALKKNVPVDLYTDSRYVKDGITQWIHAWKRNDWRTADRKPVKNCDLWRDLDAVCSQVQVTWHWVKGHDGVPGNERADALARNAIIACLVQAQSSES